jgi:hypothetical protein
MEPAFNKARVKFLLRRAKIRERAKISGPIGVEDFVRLSAQQLTRQRGAGRGICAV